MRALSAWGSSVFVRLGLTCYALLPPLRASRRAQLSNQDAACKRAIWLEGNWLLCVAPATAAYDDGVAEYTPEVVLLNRRHVQPIGPDNAELLSHFATARGLGTGKEKMQNWYDSDMNNKTVQKWFMRPLLTDKTAYKAMASKIVHLQHAAPKAPSDANDDGDDDVNMLTGAQAAAAAAKTPGSSRTRGSSTRPKASISGNSSGAAKKSANCFSNVDRSAAGNKHSRHTDVDATEPCCVGSCCWGPVRSGWVWLVLKPAGANQQFQLRNRCALPKQKPNAIGMPSGGITWGNGMAAGRVTPPLVGSRRPSQAHDTSLQTSRTPRSFR